MLLATTVLAALLSPQPAPPAFDAASIRRTLVPVPASLKTDPGRLTATAMTLEGLIQEAYGVSPLQISGAPNLGRFDVVATVVGANTRAEKLVMLQTLLADRFKLVLHPEMHEMPVMALIATRAWKGRSAPSADGDPRVVIRGAGGASKVRSVYFDGHNVTLASIANYVAPRLGRVVVDQTRLAGAFDFHVAVPIDAERATSPNVPEREVASDLVRDFMDKLGLKLESRRATVKILVVDHAEPPSDN